MNGGRPARATVSPVRNPHPPPTAIPTASAMMRVTGPSCPPIASAASTPQTASTEPTDRSMPAVMMTKVMPTARMQLMATWLATLTRLSGVTNR